MPTLDEWVAALSTERVVTIESSHSLISDLAAKQRSYEATLQAKGKPVPSRKPQLARAPGIPALASIKVAPIHLLHRLGVVTTPPVPNLADICSTWAQYRYLWAFELPTGVPGDKLRLSAPAMKIDFHQKGLMSDQIGVGMAAVVMEMFLDAPLGIDVDVALDDPTAWPLDNPGTAVPDYIFEPVDKSAQFVVECKGTRCGRAAVLDQLRRGIEQVPSLVFTDGRPAPTTLVIGTQITDAGTHVYVVDPPASDEPPSGGPTQRPERVGSREWRVSDGVGFDRRLNAVSEAKLLSYGAIDEASIAKLRAVQAEYSGPQLVAQPTVIRQDDFGSFRGVAGVLRSSDAVNVQVFQGLEETVRQAYIQGEPTGVVEASIALRARIAQSGNRRESGYGFHRFNDGNAVVLRSVGLDGSMLEFRLSPR